MFEQLHHCDVLQEVNQLMKSADNTNCDRNTEIVTFVVWIIGVLRLQKSYIFVGQMESSYHGMVGD